MRRISKIRAAAMMALSLGVTAMSANTLRAQCADGSCGTSSYSRGGYQSVSQDSFAHLLGRGTQPLFENYFTQGNANQATAGMYMSPTGIPGWVGHTYNTYQPFYPHQYLYQHHDRYHSYYDQGTGLNRTHAKYYAPPVRTISKKVYKAFEIPR